MDVAEIRRLRNEIFGRSSLFKSRLVGPLRQTPKEQGGQNILQPWAALVKGESKEMSPRIFGRIYRRLLSIPADIALSAINVPAVEAKLLSELCGVREKHSKNLPKLSNDDAAIVSGLERDGFYVTSLDELTLNSSKIMLEAGQDLAAAYKKRVSTQRSWGRADIVAELSWSKDKEWQI